MGDTGFIDTEQAIRLLDSMLECADQFDEFCRVGNDDLLPVAQKLELLSRRVYGVQVRMADEINSRNLAERHGCTSTGTLLRQALNISISDANSRVNAAKALIPRDLPTGAEAPVVLPVLASAVAEGAVGPEHVKVALWLADKMPGKLPVATREWAEEFLVEQARIHDPGSLRAIAESLENSLNPDGTLHDRDPHERMELIIGARNRSTGLTPIRGRLDDLGIEVLRKALGVFTKPQPDYQPTGADDTEGNDTESHFAEAGLTEGIVGGETGGFDIDLADNADYVSGIDYDATPDGVDSDGVEPDDTHPSGVDSSEVEPGGVEPSCAEPDDMQPGDVEVSGEDAAANAAGGGDMAGRTPTLDAMAIEPASEEGADGLRDDRPAATRLAHALIEALQVLLNTGGLPVQGGERPHITVVMDWDQTTKQIHSARLPNGVYLTPSKARRLLCDAGITPAIMGTRSEAMDLGRTSRTFNSAIRKALVLRDGGCAWPGCSRPPQWCDAHHIDWWERDLGRTCLSNGVLLCQRHHTEVHKEQWKIIMNADGRPDFIPPRWLDPEQKPRRNTMHHNTNRQV